MSEAERQEATELVIDDLVAGGAASGCEEMARIYRGRAVSLDASRPDLAKRYREAAHRQAESAACLRGERQWATPADVEPTPPMTIERACEVFNQEPHDGLLWLVIRHGGRAWLEGRSSEFLRTVTEFEATAIAERYLRDAAAAPAKEVGR